MNELAKKRNREIGQRIYDALDAKGMQRKELAEKTGILANTISYFCSGTRIPNVDQLISIAKALDVSTDYLLGLTESMQLSVDARGVSDYTGLSDRAIAILHDENISIDVRRIINILAQSTYYIHFASSLFQYLNSETANIYDMNGNELLNYSLALKDYEGDAEKTISILEEIEKHKIESFVISTEYKEGSTERSVPLDESFWSALFLNFIMDDLRKIKTEISVDHP